MRSFLTAVLAAGVALPVFAADVKIDLTGANTTIKFVGSKADGKHDGGFKKVTGTASYTADTAKTLKLSVEIDTNSLYSDDEKLTAHLKSPDFFSVKRNPTSKFTSTKILEGRTGHTIYGELTLNGKTKEIAFPATITATDSGLKLASKFEINRNDFGISYGKGKIDDTVKIAVTVDAKK